jgi:protein ImuB
MMRRMSDEALRIHPEARVALASNPDAAIHAAHGFPGANLIPGGKEGAFLGFLSLGRLLPALAKVDEERAAEIRDTLRSWGIHRFGEFAALPVPGLAERLGPEGVRLQALARGTTRRTLVPVRASPVFSASAELETPIDQMEPLLFILSRLVHQVSASLEARAQATAELYLRLKLEDGSELPLPVRLALPMRDPRLFLKLLEVELEKRPPAAPVTAALLSAEPARPRALQKGLFTPAVPDPQKLEFLLARIAKLVGPDNVGAPELIDTHRPDTFRVRHFGMRPAGREASKAVAGACTPKMGFRVFRPPLNATIDTDGGQPKQVIARRPGSRQIVFRGGVITRAGPYRMSGNWWDTDFWARDEWDVALSDGGLYCIYRDLNGDRWFVAGTYD